MLLTTLERCLQTVELNQSGNASFDINKYSRQMRAEYAREIAAASQMVERLINVSLQVDTFQELLSPTYGTILWPQHVPIRSITKLEYDPLGVFADNIGITLMNAGTDYTIDPDQKRIHLIVPYPVQYPPPVKPYRATLVGGYAYHTSETVYQIADKTGTIAPGTYEQASGLEIKIVSVDLTANTVTFIPTIGTFNVGDVIQCGTGNGVTLGDVVEESICNNYASLEAEVIRQVNYAYERRRSAGKHSTTSAGGITVYKNGYEVLQSLVDACSNFQYYGVGY